MSSRNRSILYAVAAAVGLAVLLVWAARRRAQWQRMPGWLTTNQPPEGVALELGCCTPAQSWAANRASYMTACCDGRGGAGRRTRRLYVDSLAAADFSTVRTAAQLELRGGFGNDNRY